MDPTDLWQRARQGDRRALARLLRIVEDRQDAARGVLADAWRLRPSSHLVGITGAPGSGKSTLTNALITTWRALDRRVGVIAVDPSSPFTGGALLGDRIRMQEHVTDPDVFIRSMSSRGRLGGLADATASLVTLLLAVRFDPVVVETVGVGQSEVEVVHHADTVVVVLTPGWGDGVQADKAGILEIGDVFVVNKADVSSTGETRRWLEAMLEMAPDSAWEPPIIDTVATEGAGIDELVDAIDRHRRHLTTSDEGMRRRERRARGYVEAAVAEGMRRKMAGPDLDGVLAEVTSGALDPWTAADRLLGA